MSEEKDEAIDPDYAMHNIALKRAEKLKDENTNSVDKVMDIIKMEFDKEITERQKKIELYENQILKTRKLLHILRYVLVSSYYNKKELEYNVNDEVLSKTDTSFLFDQNRIHPALKKLLGNNGSTPDFNISRSARRAKGENKPNVMVENLGNSKSRNTDSLNNKPSSSQTVNDSGASQHSSFIDRNRQKMKHQVIVGNISKWMPSSEEEKLTHKWMVYVRGPKENPDVSHFIEKVVFHLHPSYKPDDVVEISKPPFHLSRMGWGEFPIRLQIYFVCTRNKPLEIIHNLKLDKTYSGRQTLGNETIFGFYLYDDNFNISSDSEGLQDYSSIDDRNDEQKKHEIVAVTDICEKEKLSVNSTEETVSNFEHDYCTEDHEQSVSGIDSTESDCDQLSTEHSYSYPPTHEFLNIELKKQKPEQIEQPPNPLMYGLDESYSETNSDQKKKEPLFYRKTLVYTARETNNKNIQASSTSRSRLAGNKKKSPDSLIKKIYTKKLLRETASTFNVQIKLPRNDRKLLKFKNLGEALPYIFRRLPLIATGSNITHSFTASSLEEYNSWSTSKQANAEFSRAKLIKHIIDTEAVHGHENWDQKTIMTYSKTHGYTSKVNLNALGRNSTEVKLINNCFSSSADLPYHPLKYNPDLSLDIENKSASPQKKKQKLQTLNVSQPSLQMQCSYIRGEALECGVILKSEEIEDNILFNGAERTILEAVKCLADHLVRRSLHYASTSRNYKGEINIEHVQKAMNERKEMEALSQFRIKRTTENYFF